MQIHELIHPGSHDLQALFSSGHDGSILLANDTSFGVGHAPLSPLERLVLAAEIGISSPNREFDHLAWGEDVKIMGVRRGNAVDLTVACAMIGRHLSDIDDYLAEKAAVEKVVYDLAARHGFSRCGVSVNAADDLSAGYIYLTVTGTSGEAGDDGEVGRGNRVNGLITPCRPMSLEAAAGKNPVTHVGKIYNVAARDVAETLVATVPEIVSVHCLMLSRIGKPVTSPALVQVKLAARERAPVDRFERQVADVVAECLSRIPKRIDDFVAGAVSIF